jgi:hypothetical protein
MSKKRKLIIWPEGQRPMGHEVHGEGSVGQFVDEVERDGRKWLAIPNRSQPELLLNPDKVVGFCLADIPEESPITVPELVQ